MINILIRLHNNIDKFITTIDSIFAQNYNNINLLVSVDDEPTYSSIINQKIEKCKYIYINLNNLYPGEKTLEIDPNCSHEIKNIYGSLFLPNIYMNILHQYIKPGYILYLDVGDTILDNRMFNELEQYMPNKTTIVWRTIFKNDVIGPTEWKGYPVLFDIDSSSFMFHSDYIENWTGYRFGDFRVCKAICKKSNTIFIPNIYIKKDNDT